MLPSYNRNGTPNWVPGMQWSNDAQTAPGFLRLSAANYPTFNFAAGFVPPVAGNSSAVYTLQNNTTGYVRTYTISNPSTTPIATAQILSTLNEAFGAVVTIDSGIIAPSYQMRALEPGAAAGFTFTTPAGAAGSSVAPIDALIPGRLVVADKTPNPDRISRDVGYDVVYATTSESLQSLQSIVAVLTGNCVNNFMTAQGTFPQNAYLSGVSAPILMRGAFWHQPIGNIGSNNQLFLECSTNSALKGRLTNNATGTTIPITNKVIVQKPSTDGGLCLIRIV